MVSNMKRVEKKVIGADSYRRLVLTHIYLLCRSRCATLNQLGADELRAAGARIVRNEFGVRGIEVDLPPENERGLRAELLMVHIADNSGFLPEKARKRKTCFARERKKPAALANAQTMDEDLMGSIGPSAIPKDRF
jgi:hypothetical protein